MDGVEYLGVQLRVDAVPGRCSTTSRAADARPPRLRDAYEFDVAGFSEFPALERRIERVAMAAAVPEHLGDLHLAGFRLVGCRAANSW
jgi:hypothetical protein